MKFSRQIISTIILLVVLLGGCASEFAPVAVATTEAAPTQVESTATLTPDPTETPIPTPTAIRTPPALPLGFTTDELNPLDTPNTYIANTCQYLRAKWDPANAEPGTVVMTIMFHSITDGQVTYYDQISVEQFNALMRDLHEQGFEAITMQQFHDFVYENANIPPRSALLIVDDRKYRAYFDTHFKPYHDQWSWPVVNAWISAPDTLADLWADNAAIETEGWVDHQAHGYIHNINITADSSEDFIRQEMGNPILLMQEHFNKTPIAYIWPGGGFSAKAAQIGREMGYELGFTINPRGPVMFNWVPQSDTNDPMRPSYIPEGAANDPLMTLPRYWSTDARTHIDSVRRIGKAAAEYAESVKATELEYYDIVCSPTFGDLP